MKKWTNIFWDWNGTLLNDVDECVELINVSLKKRGLAPLNRGDYLEKFQFPVKKYYEAVGFDFSRESFEEAGKEFISGYSKKMFDCQLHQSALDILKKFKEAGLKQYVLSALNEDALHKCIANFGLAEYFDKVRGLDDHYAHSKVELGKKLLEDAEISPRCAVMIGDTIHDFDTAQAMGIDCILVASGHNSLERLKICNAPVFESLEMLRRQIEKMFA